MLSLLFPRLQFTPLACSPVLLILVVALGWMQSALADNLFIGCGFEIDFKEMVFDTPYPSVCYTACRDRSFTYYTHRADKGECICYIYPPPAAEYTPGGPDGDCDGELRFNIIKTNWDFHKCYPWFDMTMTPSDSFKACMDGCAPDEVAIAQPTGTFPGYTGCVCAKLSDLEGIQDGECDVEQFYVYTHTPTPVPTARRVNRALAIAQRQAWQPRGPY